MAYIDTQLARNERRLFETHQHWFVLIRHGAGWLLLAVLAVVGIVLAATRTTTLEGNPDGKLTIPFQGWLLLALLVLTFLFVARFALLYLQWINHQYIVTNLHVIRLEGVVNKSRDDARLDHINNTDVRQSLLGRMIGYGDIRVLTGNDTDEDTFTMVERPQDFRRAIDDARDDFEQSRRGVTQQQLQDLMAKQQPQPQFYPQPQYPQPQYPQSDPYAPRTVYVDPYGGRAPYIGPNEPTAAIGGSARPRPPRSVNNPADIPTLINQLAKLRDAGVISETEFQQKKADLMSRM